MDVASLAINVENGQVIQATTSLNSLTVAGGKAEASAQRLTRRMALLEIEARNIDGTMGKTTRSFSQFYAIAAGGFVAQQIIKNTIEAQNAMAQLGAAVQSTGGIAGRSVEQLDAFSMAMQQTTTYSDEAVKSAQSVLLTFDKIRGVNFDRTTQAAADLAARMGGDLQGAAVQLGKALQDPTTGLTALRRSGVSFSESQITLIKRLYDTGRAAEGQVVILKEMEHQFGGSAAAARNTLGGALTYLQNQWGDLFEVTGESSGGIVAAINAMGAAIPAVRGLFDSFFGGIQLAALDARIAIETVADAITKTPWGALKAAVGGLTGNTSLTLSGGADMAKNSDMRELTAARDAIRAQLAAQVTGTGAATAANKAHANSIKEIIPPSKEWLKVQKEINDLTVESVVALGAAQAKRQEGLRGLQEELAMQDRLVAALKLGQQAYEDQKDTEEARQAVASAGITTWDAEYDAAVAAAQAIIARRREQEKLTEAQKEWNDMLDASIKKDKERAASTPKATQSIIDSMKGVWEAGKKMFGAASAGFGIGYGIGTQSGGNRGSSALGGAASGAMAGMAMGGPVGAAIGGVSGFIGGILGAGKAAREADKAMQELQKSLANTMAGIRAQLAGDSLAGALIQNKAQFDALRKQTEDAYAGGKNEAQRMVVLGQLNVLEAQRIAQLKAEAALVLQQLTEDIKVQILRNEGRAAEADSMAKAIDQERRFAELRKQGIDAATIDLLRQSEATRDAIAAKQAADDAALAAAEKLREAAEAAAAAAQKALEQNRALEDLNVELLRAKGQGGAADSMEFDLGQQRRLEEAQGSQSEEYVRKLIELQQLQRDSRAAQQLIDSTGSGGDGGAGAAVRSAVSSVQSVVTERSSLMLIDLTRQEVSYLARITTAVENGGGSGGSGVRITVNNTFTREVDETEAQRIADSIVDKINSGMGTIQTRETLRTGSVGR